MKIITYILIVNLCIAYFHSDANQNSSGNSIKVSYPNYFKHIKLLRDSTVLDYAFKDEQGKTIRLSDYKGKFVFIDLWYSGCGFCISANNALKIVHEKLKDKNIIFLSISIDNDREKWIQSITPNAKPSKLNPWAGQYVPALGAKTLYTGGTGASNDFIEKYVPDKSYPKLLFIGPSGKMISDHPPRPDGFPVNHPEELTEFLLKYIE